MNAANMKHLSLAMLVVLSLSACGPGTKGSESGDSTDTGGAASGSGDSTDTGGAASEGESSSGGPVTTGSGGETVTDGPVATTTGAQPGMCEVLDEAGCLAEPDCQGQYGAPHVEQDGMTCVDYEQQVFVGCVARGVSCPPFVPTVCPEGQPEPRFDMSSGCIPFGFEICDGGAPGCQ